MNVTERKLASRLTDLARDWHVVIHETIDTTTSVIALGVRGDEHVVLKVMKACFVWLKLSCR